MKKLLDNFSATETAGKVIRFVAPQPKEPVDELIAHIYDNPQNDNTTNYLKVIFHYLYPHWLRHQHFVGIVLYTGFSTGTPFWLVPFIWVLLYMAYSHIRLHNLRFGVRRRYFMTRFVFFVLVTAVQAAIAAPFVYVFLPQELR